VRTKEDSVDDVILIRSGGVPAEYRYLERRFGRRGVDWELVSQSFVTKNGRSFDELLLSTNMGMRKVVFDVSALFGRW